MTERADIKQAVQAKYGEAARRVVQGQEQTGCGCGSCGCDPITSDLYQIGETAGLPDEAVLASLGCGNPTALTQLNPGDVVECAIAGITTLRTLIVAPSADA